MIPREPISQHAFIGWITQCNKVRRHPVGPCETQHTSGRAHDRHQRIAIRTLDNDADKMVRLNRGRNSFQLGIQLSHRAHGNLATIEGYTRQPCHNSSPFVATQRFIKPVLSAPHHDRLVPAPATWMPGCV
jgi:hypothetical protein